jgi:hypothetical protein
MERGVSCSNCGLNYNESNLIPRLLIKCGHTFCSSCLEALHNNSLIECPEDKALTMINEVSSLPINMTIVSLIKNESVKFVNFDDGQSISTLKSDNEKDNHFLKLKKALGAFKKERVTQSNSINLDNISLYDDKIMESNKLTCQNHLRPFELICITDNMRICSLCAVFGSHKSHKTIKEVDVIRETLQKGDLLVKQFELLNTNLDTYKKKGFL